MLMKNKNYFVHSATQEDLDYVFYWLFKEYQKDGEGYWVNRTIIEDLFERGNMIVIREDNLAVAFMVYTDYEPTILNVKQTHKRQGLGSHLLHHWMDSAEDNLSFFNVIIAPETAVPFYLSHGFSLMGQQGYGISDWPTATIALARTGIPGFKTIAQSDVVAELPPLDDFTARIFFDVAVFDCDGQRCVSEMPARKEKDGSYTLALRVFRPRAHDDMCVNVLVVDEDGTKRHYQDNARAASARAMGVVKGGQGDAYLEVFRPNETFRTDDADERYIKYASLPRRSLKNYLTTQF